MPSIREDSGRNGGFEAGGGCGPVGLVVLAIALGVLIHLARKYGWAR